MDEGKGPHERPGYYHQHYFSLEFVAVLILINPWHALSSVVVDTKQD